MSVFLDSRAIIAPLHIKYNDLCKFLTNRRHKKSRIPHTIKDARYLILFITEIPAGPQTEHTVLFCSFFSVLLFRSCCDLFLLYIRRSLLISCKFICVCSSSACHGAKHRTIPEQSCHRNVRFDHLLSTCDRSHAKHSSASLIQISHHISRIIVRNSHFQRSDRLKKYRRCLKKSFLNAWVVAVLNAISEESTG